MIGLAIGAGALLSFVMIRRAMWRHAYACHGGHGGFGPWHHQHHGWHGNPWGGNPWGGSPWRFSRRARLYAAMAALDLSPAQEKLVRGELRGLGEKAWGLKPELRSTRGDVARAVGGAAFDKAALDGAFARHDAALADMRAAVTGAFERIHAALDDEQREKLADMLDRGARGRGAPGGASGGGPYRV